MSYIQDGVGTNVVIRRILLVIFAVSLFLGVGGVYLALRQRAIEQASKEARLVLATAAAISEFTDAHVSPLLEKLPPDQFYKQAVPFFTVSAVFERLRRRYPNFALRQAALNPTNTGDRPTPHEVELTLRFRDEPALTELQGLREEGDRTLFYLATPIRVNQPQCLACHSTPDKAPRAMVAAYGTSNGFGWRLGDTIGTMELSVPVTDELRGTIELAATIAVALLLVLLVTYLALTTALGAALVDPLRRLTSAAETSSTGSAEPIVLAPRGTSEVRRLGDAIARLDTSLRKALRLVAEARSRPPKPEL